MALAGLTLGPRAALAALGDPAEYGPKDHLQTTLRLPGAKSLIDDRAPGLRNLGLDRKRDAVLFTPEGLDPTKSIPLVVVLHGKEGEPNEAVGWFKAYAAEHKFLVLAPPSRKATWDVDKGPIGPDAAFIDKAIDWVSQRFPIDGGHLAIAGFSDGGSYALGMGLQNGDFFSDVLAFEAVRFGASDAKGRPRFFFSHGRVDEGVPLGNCQKMVKQLQTAGYDVVLDIHPKGHIVADQGVKAAVARFLS